MGVQVGPKKRREGWRQMGKGFFDCWDFAVECGSLTRW